MEKKRLLAFLMAVLLMGVFFNGSALADELSELQDKYDNIQGSIEDKKEEYDDLEGELKANQKKVTILESNISKVNGEIKDMENQIDGVQEKIDVTTKELNAAIEEYNYQDAMMKQRIKAMYQNGTTLGYIEVILESQSFSDFISRADIMQKIVDHDINLLEEMKKKREEIDRKKAELEGDKAELLALKGDLDKKKQQLVAQKADRKTLVALVSRQMSQVKASIEAEEKAAKKLEKEIKALMVNTGDYDGSKYAVIKRADFPSGKSPRITSYYGSRTDPVTGKKGAYHAGLDIGTALITNIPIYAMAPGTVILAGWYGGYGNAVIIDHGSGLATLYAHNNKVLVSKGEKVLGGQKVSLSGSTGKSTGPHLHFGVMKNGSYVDPTPYFMFGN